MNPTKLPSPSELVVHCRLCEGVLEISLNNPRRVCAHCGEVNLPSDEVAAQPARHAPRFVTPSLRGTMSEQSRSKWLAHAIALGVQLAIVLLAALGLGSGGKYGLGLLFAGLAFIYFCVYATIVSVPVAFLKTTRQVVLFDSVVPLLTVFALWLSVFGPSVGSQRVPAATPPLVRAPVPPPPRPVAAPKPRAPKEPGWEQSAMLASFSVDEKGTAFRIRFVPHFTGTLEVRAGSPQLFDVFYGSVTCQAVAEEATECFLGLERPLRPSAVRFELSGAPQEGSRQFGGQVTTVRVDSSGTAQPR
ncbi:MAG: hypothetical protein Q8K32_30845 [Archangium sp.]|nr:hypothetical protein [Archangium sp.]